MISNSLNHILSAYLNLRHRRIGKMYDEASLLQTKWFHKLIYKGRQTQYGKSNNFDQINSFIDFQALCPLQDYNSIKSEIFKMMHGEPDILWPGQVHYFAKSSGTTEESSKYIPVSREMIYYNFRSCGWDATACIYDQCPEANIAGKKNLLMAGSLSRFEANPKVQIGDVSAIMIEHLPSFTKFWYTPEFDIALMDNWEEKIKLMAAIISKEDVNLFGGVPTWTLVLFREMLRLTGKQNILEIWPNAKIYTHGGVGFEPYREEFKRLLPSPDFKYQETYNASEGYFAAQDNFGSEDLLLMVDNGIFYEFIPCDHPDQKSILLEDVALFTHYELVITTVAGLWRYRLGDTIYFTSKAPYKIRISGRTNQFINVFGEEVMIGDTDKAIAIATKKTACDIKEYTVAPIFMDTDTKGGHEWLVEFKKQPKCIDQFEKILDHTLQEINGDYQAKRFKDMALENLVVNVVPTGGFDKWLKRKGKFGNQHKVPRLSNERKHLEELKQILKDL